MPQETENVSRKALGIRSLICVVASFFFARWLFYPTWSEALGFAVVISVVFVIIDYIVDMACAMRGHEQRQVVPVSADSLRYQPGYDTNNAAIDHRMKVISSVPPLTEQESLDELKVFFVGPESRWQLAVYELVRRRQDAASRYTKKLLELEAAREREDDAAIPGLESQADKLKLYQRNLQEAETAVTRLMAEVNAIIDVLSQDLAVEKNPGQSQWHKPVVATLGKLHAIVNKFPLTPPKDGEDAKLIHYAEQLEQATAALNALREKMN